MIRFFWMLVLMALPLGNAQIAPTQTEMAAYTGLLAAVSRGDLGEVEGLLARGTDPDVRDHSQRTPLHVAAHFGYYTIAKALLKAGANPNALEFQRYDLITIAAVRDDAQMIQIGLSGGANPKAITSVYDGTALIAAAHLGNVDAVRVLIAAKAPLDHVNNLGWTALLEAILLGDGGARHTEVVRMLIAAGAMVNLADRSGVTPLAHVKQRGYTRMVELLEAAGAHE